MTRATERFEEKREVILDGAARLFNQHGIKGALLSELAQRVGLATNSLSYYYRKKEDLACACLQRAIDALVAVADSAARQRTLAQRIRTFIGGYLGLLADIAEGRHAELIVFSDLLSLAPPQRDPMAAAYTQMFRRVRGLLDAADAPPLQPAARNARAHLLLSTVSWARAWLSRHEPVDYARVAAQIADIVLLGIATPGRQITGVVPGQPTRALFGRRGRRHRHPRRLPARGDPVGQRERLPGCIGRSHRRRAAPDQGLLLSPPRNEGGADRRLLRAHVRRRARGAERSAGLTGQRPGTPGDGVSLRCSISRCRRKDRCCA